MAIGYKQMIEEAETEIVTIDVDAAAELVGKEDVVFIDLRDIRELQREGKIPGAIHAPRGMLEFWVDPESPYYRDVFGQDKNYVFYCAGAWRSALAVQTVQRMDMKNVCHMAAALPPGKKPKNRSSHCHPVTDLDTIARSCSRAV